MGPILVAAGLTKSYGMGEARVRALDGVDLVVPRGQLLSIMGPSGCGKSTLLNLLGGLDVADQGTVHIDGTELTELDDDARSVLRRRRLGFVFQFFNLLPSFTASENVALPLQLDGVPERRALDRARAALARVNMDGRRDHVPSQLSGGEQQRTAIARALVFEPDLLLADEPTGNLDTRAGNQVMDLLRSIAGEGGKTIVMVTHDERYGALGDRLVRVRDGQIIEDTVHGEGASQGSQQ
jgi:putative ABC transport system ATP-binding protein